MSDYLGAQITIGDCISRALAPRLCKLITQARVALDWDEPPLEPTSAEELLAARCSIDGEMVLQLVADDAPYGAVVDLEAFLIKQEIPFDRQSDSGHGYDACLVTYRPDQGRTEWLATNRGEPAVLIGPIWELEEQLQSLARSFHKMPRHIARERLQEILAQLREVVPPRPRALPSFEIGKTVGLRKAA